MSYTIKKNSGPRDCRRHYKGGMSDSQQYHLNLCFSDNVVSIIKSVGVLSLSLQQKSACHFYTKPTIESIQFSARKKENQKSFERVPL